MTKKKKKPIAPAPKGLNLIDTHTHLYMSHAFPDGDDVAAVQRAIESGVNYMIFPGINEEVMEKMEKLHERFPQNTGLAAGIHPDDLTDNWSEELKSVRKRMKSGDYIAIGEVGIDLYRDKSHAERQKEAFEEQLRWAIEDRLPVIIHCRDGLEETLEVISRFRAEDLPRLLFHSFTGTIEDVRRIREVVPKAMFAVNGVATFKNAPELREAVKEIGIDHILLETDSPYLAPTPLRGERNESAFLPYIAVSVAETLGVPAETLAERTSESARRFFSISGEGK